MRDFPPSPSLYSKECRTERRHELLAPPDLFTLASLLRPAHICEQPTPPCPSLDLPLCKGDATASCRPVFTRLVSKKGATGATRSLRHREIVTGTSALLNLRQGGGFAVRKRLLQHPPRCFASYTLSAPVPLPCPVSPQPCKECCTGFNPFRSSAARLEGATEARKLL